MERIRNIVVLVKGQLWLIPLIFSVGALWLAYWVLTSRSEILKTLNDSNFWWLYSGDARSARDLLSSLLSGLMTMTSLVVSVTFVILTLAASQLGPRLIRAFMADRQIQTVLGLFLGTILYVLVVLRSLEDSLGSEGVPHVAITIGSGLTMICLLALLFYVHKIAASIVADSIVERVAGELHRDIHTMLPKRDEAPDRDVPRLPERRDRVSVSLERSGYIQVIDYKRLFKLACKEKAAFEVNVRAGHFILRNGEHVVVHADASLSPDTVDGIRSAFVVGGERSPAQDLEFGLRQLVEIALRALSPGINDPYTAIAVVDRLGAALEEIFQRSLEREVWRDDAGDARVVAKRSDPQGLVDAAFNEIRQAARTLPAVLIRMADVLGQTAPALRTDDMRDAVDLHLAKLAETVDHATLAPSDLRAVRRRIEQARIAVAGKPPDDGPDII